jgi:hypothetical protein
MYSENEEDPVEVYKREFKRKRWERDHARKVRIEQNRRTLHRYFRSLAYAAALFAVIVLFDKYMLGSSYTEPAEKGWQERGAGSRRGRGPLYSYMETEHFIIGVPSQIHLIYPYHLDDKPSLTIDVSPIFQIPTYAVVVVNNNQYNFQVEDTIHAMSLLVWALLISSVATILLKNYSWYVYCFSYIPLFLALATFLKMFW